jgi:ribosomal protein S18 acetylase RimI-like enzyme
VTVAIRRAGPADWPAIWPVWHETVAAGETYTWDPATTSEDARSLWLLSPPAETWAALGDAGEVAGTYLLKSNQPGLGSHVSNAAFMVAAPARGHGIGRQLLGHCLGRARELGYEAMQFNAVVSTNTNAVALWRSAGFEIVGTVPAAFRHPTHGLVDIHVMHRFL